MSHCLIENTENCLRSLLEITWFEVRKSQSLLCFYPYPQTLHVAAWLSPYNPSAASDTTSSYALVLLQEQSSPGVSQEEACTPPTLRGWGVRALGMPQKVFLLPKAVGLQTKQLGFILLLSLGTQSYRVGRGWPLRSKQINQLLKPLAGPWEC